MLKRPTFNHNCSDCIFLGRFLKHDLYVHPDDDLYARIGDEEMNIVWGYEKAFLYGSGESNAESDRILFEALKRSIKLNIFPPKKCESEKALEVLPTTVLQDVMSVLTKLSHNADPETRGYLTAAISVLSLIKER